MDDSIIHLALGITIPAFGGLFIFLLKRTFSDFEVKLASLFNQMSKTLEQQQQHDTKIQLITQRIEQLEKVNGR